MFYRKGQKGANEDDKKNEFNQKILLLASKSLRLKNANASFFGSGISMRMIQMENNYVRKSWKLKHGRYNKILISGEARIFGEGWKKFSLKTPAILNIFFYLGHFCRRVGWFSTISSPGFATDSYSFFLKLKIEFFVWSLN